MGASLQQVLDEFNVGQGDSAMTLSSFKSALKRVREAQRGGKGTREARSKGSPSASEHVAEAPAKPSMADFFLPRPAKK